MSPPSSGSYGQYRKPRADIYTMMLALAFVAIVLGCICLYLEVADYGQPPFQLGLSSPLQPGPTVAVVEKITPRVLIC